MKNFKMNKRTELYIVIAILFLYFMFQLPSLNNQPWELYDDWRQSDTYSIAQNYYLNSMNPLRPEFNYDGAEDNFVQLELQIIPYVSAVAFKLIGEMTPFIPRFLGLLLFLGSALYTYKIMRKATSFLPSVAGLILYLVLPINLIYSRAIMPESTALFFLTGAIWYLLLWYEDDREWAVWLSAVFTSFAIMEKTPTIFVGLLILFVFLKKLGLKSFKDMRFYGYGAISLLLPVVYYVYSASVATMTYVSSIASKHIFTEKILSVFTPEAKSFFSENMPKFFCTAVLIASFFGFLLTINKKRSFFSVLTVSFLLELATIVAIIKFGYYLIFIAPICAILFAVLLDELFSWKKLVAIIACLLVLVNTWQAGITLYRESVVVNEDITIISQFVNDNIEPDAVIAFAANDPVFINAIGRHGYRANIQYHDFIPIGAEAELAYYKQVGVDYYIALNHWVYKDSDGSYIAYVKQTFPVHAQNELCTIYKLQDE